MWRELRRVFPQAKFRRQSPVGPYFADILSFRHNLVIELDGGQHASQQPEDEARTRYIESQGFRVVRFWNNEVLTNADGVLQYIAPIISADD